MTDKEQLKRIFRRGNLTPEEVTRDEEIRRRVQQEFPPARPLSPPAPDSISETLRRAIQESNRSLDEISRDAGVSQTMVARFLASEHDLRMITADRLASVLGLKLIAGQ